MDQSKLIMLAALILLVLVIARALIFYNANGVSWDFVSSYLNAVNILKPGFFSHLTIANSNGIFIENSFIYFELQRAPLPYLILALFILPFGVLVIPIFIVLTIILVFIGSFIVSDSLGQNRLLLLSFVLVPYVLAYLAFEDAQDLLAFGLVLIALGFLLRKSKYFGLFLALAGLAKYTSLIFVPLFLLFDDRKKALDSFVIFILITVPWPLLTTFLAPPYGSYYLQSVQNDIGYSINILTTLAALNTIIYPVVAMIFVLILYLFIERKKLSRAAKKAHGLKDRLYSNYNVKVLFWFTVLAIIGLVVVSGGGAGGFTIERYADFVYMAVAIISATVISFCIKRIKVGTITLNNTLPFALVAISSVIIVFFYGVMTSDTTASLAYSTMNPYFQNEISQIDAYGLASCRVISNDWVYLLYNNISAYPPYYFNGTLRHYPILISSYGVGNYNINFTNYTKISATNLTIYLPRNYSSACS